MTTLPVRWSTNSGGVLRTVKEWLLNHVSNVQGVPVGWRVEMLRRLGMRIGEGVVVRSHCWWGGTDVTLGERSYVGTACFIDNTAPVTIGRQVGLGAETTIITGDHPIGGPDSRAGAATPGPVTIEDGCWVGARATILPGVTIRRGCVIGAGAVVTRSTEPHGVYVGSPARRIRDLDEEEPEPDGTDADKVVAA